MAKKAFLKLEADLIPAHKEMFPRPGKIVFRIEGATDGSGKILLEREISIRSDLLPEVVTAKHLSGRMRLEFFEQIPDNSAYEKAVADEASIRNRRQPLPIPEDESD